MSLTSNHGVRDLWHIIWRKILTNIRLVFFPLITAVMTVVILMLVSMRPLYAAQRVTTTAMVGERQIELVLPLGHCLMEENRPSDIAFLNAVRGVFARSHHLLAGFADCGEQKNWRMHKRPYLDRFGQYITPLQMVRSNMKVEREKLVAQLCRNIDKMSNRTKEDLSRSAKKRMESQVDGAKFDDMDIASGSYSDDSGCYFSSRQNVTTPDGKSRVIAGVSVMTLVRGKLIQLNLYQLYKDDSSFSTLLDMQRANIRALLAANGEWLGKKL